MESPSALFTILRPFDSSASSGAPSSGASGSGTVKLYDRGAFAISKDHLLAASAKIHNGKQLEEVLLKYHGKQIRLPLNPAEIPANEFLDWNWKNIFKTPVRYFEGGGELVLAAEGL